MPFVLNLILLALLCVPVYLGWRWGFFKSVLRLGRLGLAILITVSLGSTVAGWLNDGMVYPAVREAVYEKMDALADDVSDEISSTAEGGAAALAERLPAAFRPYLDTRDFDPSADLHALAEDWTDAVSAGISRVIATAVGFVLVFVVAFILLTVAVSAVTGLIHRIPLARAVDRILGLSLGLLIGGIGVLLLSALLAAIFS